MCFTCTSSGFESVELNFEGRLELDSSDILLNEIRKFAENRNIIIDSLYSRRQWATPISSANPEILKQGEAVLSRLVDIAAILEARIILVIPGAVDNSCISTTNLEITPYEDVYKRSLETISRTALKAEKSGITLAVENVPGKFLLSPLEMEQFIVKTESSAVGCYFDVANCLYCQGFPEQWIRILGKHIKAVHLKDYKLASGNLTGFVNIFEGDVNWPEVTKALSETGYDLSMTSEVLPSYKYHPEHLWESVSRRIDSLIEDIK
ncbi:MAG: sugar phosphate isomerase/epimerase [Spirochaetales bacterium]|nr:sugar phosphate isomerase/epimerase [Spirochaetales bacterium]